MLAPMRWRAARMSSSETMNTHSSAQSPAQDQTMASGGDSSPRRAALCAGLETSAQSPAQDQTMASGSDSSPRRAALCPGSETSAQSPARDQTMASGAQPVITKSSADPTGQWF